MFEGFIKSLGFSRDASIPLGSVARLNFEGSKKTITLKRYHSLDISNFLGWFTQSHGSSYEFLAFGKNGLQLLVFEEEQQDVPLDFIGFEHLNWIHDIQDIFAFKSANSGVFLASLKIEPETSRESAIQREEHDSCIQEIMRVNPLIVRKQKSSVTHSIPESISLKDKKVALTLTKINQTIRECIYFVLTGKLPINTYMNTHASYWKIHVNSIIEIAPKDFKTSFYQRKGQDIYTFSVTLTLDYLFKISEFELSLIERISAYLGKSVPTCIKVKEV